MNFIRTCGAAMIRLLAVAAWAISLSACMIMPSSGADAWKEEVLLHDGQKIIVERSQTYKGRSEPGQSAPIGEHTIRFSVPGSAKVIAWTSEYGEDIGRTDFNLSALHVKDGTPYVVAEPNLCLSYNKWGRPNPPYVVFRHDGNAWKRIGFDALPPEFTTVNVVKRIRGIDVENLVKAKEISAAQVAALNRSLERSESKAILREPIRYDPDCIPMVGNGLGRWRALAWFESKSTLGACQNACRADNFDELHCPCKRIFPGN